MGAILALLAAVAGGLLFLKMKIPAGAMIGSLFGVVLFNVLTGMASFPPEVKTITQMVIGGFIGTSITMEIVRALRKLAIPAVILCGGMMSAGLIIAWILSRTTGFNLATCLLSAAPGGMADVSLIAIDMGGDTSIIVSMHIVRLIGAVCICPALFRIIAKRFDAPRDDAHSDVDLKERVHPFLVWPADATCLQKLGWMISRNGITIIVALAGGTIGYLLNVPAGTMVFSMAAVGAFSIFTGRGYMSTSVRRFVQMVAGATIGQNVTRETLMNMKQIIIPALVLTVVYIITTLLIGYAMFRFGKMEFLTALFSGTPAGASDMALIAADLGGNSPIVAMMHVIRLVVVIALFPQITYAILVHCGEL